MRIVASAVKLYFIMMVSAHTFACFQYNGMFHNLYWTYHIYRSCEQQHRRVTFYTSVPLQVNISVVTTSLCLQAFNLRVIGFELHATWSNY